MATTKKKGDPKPPPNTVTVSHEEVPFTPTDKPTQGLKILTLDEMVELELRKLSPAETKLAELEQKFADLNQPIAVSDKGAYKAAKEAWREVQSFRTGVENTALNIRREYTTINKAIATKEGQIVDRAKPLETRLQGLWKAVDDEEARLEREEEARQEAALRARLDELTVLGMTLSDGYYSIGDTISVDVATLRVMPVDKFYKLRDAVKARSGELAEAEEKRQQEEQRRQEQLETERQQARQANKETRSMVVDALGLIWVPDIEKFKWTNGEHLFNVTEAELFDVDHTAFMAKVAEIKAKKETLNERKAQREREETERQQRIARENRDKSRAHALAQAGLELRGTGFTYTDVLGSPITVDTEELFELDDKTFSDRVVSISNEVGERRSRLVAHEQKERELAAKLKLRKEEIASVMEGIGFKYVYNTQAFEFGHPLYSKNYSWQELLERDAQQFEILVGVESAHIAAANHRQAKLDQEEKTRQEKERQAGLTDAQMFKEYMDMLKAIAPTGMKTAGGKKRAAEFAQRLAALCDEFQPKGKKEVAP